MLTHDKMVKKMLANPKVKASYDAMEGEFAFLDECLKARKNDPEAVGLPHGHQGPGHCTDRIRRGQARANTPPQSIRCENMPKHADANSESGLSRHKKNHGALSLRLRAKGEHSPPVLLIIKLFYMLADNDSD